jgi:glutathione S-transferase
VLTLYGNQGSGNCYKVRLLLSQLNIPFRSVELDVVAGDQRQPDYRAKNPNGKVPMIEFENGECLPESGAILYRFAQGTPFWPEDPNDQTRVLQWMFFEQNTHETNIAVARFWCHYLDAEKQYEKQLVEKREKGYSALEVMEDALIDRAFFVAERYSIADIALYAYTHVADEGGFSFDRFPAIRAWFDRVVSQPGHITISKQC